MRGSNIRETALMGKRENRVESYLQDQVLKVGGDTRKFTSPGHAGVPDQIVMVKSEVWFVETKSKDGTLSSNQEREHIRLRNLGMKVRTVYTVPMVDEFIMEVLHATGQFPRLY